MYQETAVKNGVLLIEDNPECVALIGRALNEMGSLGKLEVSQDCDGALTRLRQSSRNRPRLIFLALEMPQGNAIRFLKAVKTDPTLRMIPVVILATGDSADHVSACYSLGVAGYLVKSDMGYDFLEKIRSACGYWALSRVPMT